MTWNNIDTQYSDLMSKIIYQGVDVYHKRTGKKRRTVLSERLVYSVSDGSFPIITTRQAYPISAIKEMLCYIRGFNNINQFRSVGLKTWDKTYERWSGKNEDGDMNGIYGVQWRNWADPVFNNVDQLKDVYQKLLNRNDDSNLVMTAVNPGETHDMCMPACMHTHRWNIVDGKLYQHSFQRSADVPLGLVSNIIQAAWLLKVMGHITGIETGCVYHTIDNAHVYEDQMDIAIYQSSRRIPVSCNISMKIPEKLTDLDYLDHIVKAEDFVIEGYEHSGKLDYPLAG